MKSTIDRTEILQHALIGFQLQRKRIDQQIADLQRELNGNAPQVEQQAQPQQEKPKRRLSARGRANIIRATKERWRRARAAGRKRLG
ncbi:MAG TPA: hypothetical protein VFA33_05735 [Bryobacteraceae bacterium]|nr:hypothetical protein [Bryobacteraceae bacterium]